MPKWKAWYSDGTIYTSRQTEWRSLPAKGAVIVMAYFDDGTRRNVSGNEYYWLDNEFHQSDSYPTDVDAATVKAGAWVADEEFDRIQREAMLDMTPP